MVYGESVRPRRLVVFTDLDGTLLDHETYSYAAAAEALDLLAEQNIPLVLCSSKTRAEIELLRLDLRLSHPFISENGGGVFLPRGYFSVTLREARRLEGYEVIQLGAPYWQLVETLHRVASQLGIQVVGFSDMSPEAVAKECKLTVLEARLAKMREYDEPFRFVQASAAAQSRLFAALHRAGLRCTRGGRYHHVTGVADKALAVRTLKSLYARAWGQVLAVGLGDSPSDLSLLREVDIPVIVRNPAAGASARLLRKVPGARLTKQPGPRGWNEAILDVVGRHVPPAG